MYEVEAKVHISKTDFNRLQKELKKTAEFKGKYVKKDVYFNDIKDAFIRIREENGKPIFGLKNKGVEKGIETNTEIEWNIKDKTKWSKLLKKLDIKPFIKKTKNNESYQLNDFVIELNRVPRLGYFLEIERVVKTKNQILKAKKELIDMFKKLGYSQKDFEKKYYLELLQELNS